MARSVVDVTQVWAQVSDGSVAVVFTVEKAGEGYLLLNDNALDLAAERIISADIGLQIEQSTLTPTFARATGDGWQLVVAP